MAKNKSSPKKIPLFQTKIIETHCHLDYLDDSELDELLEKSFSVGIESFITIGVSPDNQKKVLHLTKKHTQIYGSLGIHPHEASGATDEVLEHIKEIASKEDKILALGEMGLDYHYEHSPRLQQKNIFERQIQMSLDLKLPIIIHSRDADQDMMAILKNFSNESSFTGVIHSFTSGKKLAEMALDLGLYLGFNGIITFNSAQNVRDILKICPLNRILLETDTPYLTPVPFRGKENAPYYLPFVAQKAAEICQIDIEDFLRAAYQNSRDLFKIPS